MMGLGKRFGDNAYDNYKPFINANGKLIIERVIKPLVNKYERVYVACSKQSAYSLNKIFSPNVVVPIVLQHSTGAADTVQQACNYLDEDSSLLCVDCDTIISPNAIDKIPEEGNVILSFIDEDLTGIYSYLTVENETIKNISEKNAVSNIANSGVYLFNSVKETKKYCIQSMEDRENYLSYAVSMAINDGQSFRHIDISNEFDCVGTPKQLEDYCKKQSLSGKIICFDVDKTLIRDVMLNIEPITENINFCNYLYDNGVKIILLTARGMLSTNGNIEHINKVIRPKIENALNVCGVKYHELYVGKPYADYYIDDKGISSYDDLNKMTGIYFKHEN